MNRITVSLSALILFVATAGLEAGSDTGPGVYTFNCPANRSKTIHERYVGGRLAVLKLTGNGATDLDIYVYDSNGNLVTRGIGLSDRELVSFVPRRTGNYWIVIRNLGRVFNQARLRTN